MKFTLKYFTALMAIATLIIFTGCGSDPDPEKSPSDQQLEKLVATWKVDTSAGGVKLDGVSKDSDYSTFQLTISGTEGATSFNYSTTGRPASSPWPSSGNWAFGADVLTQIVRDPDTDDERDMNYAISANGNNLKITFAFSGSGYPARVSNVTGQWEFNLSK